MVEREVSNSSQTFTNGLVPDGRSPASLTRVALANHVSNPQLSFDFNKLDLTQLKRRFGLSPIPLSVFALGFLPFVRQGNDKPSAPTADVVADMDNDAGTVRLRTRRITYFVLNRHISCPLVPWYRRKHNSACACLLFTVIWCIKEERPRPDYLDQGRRLLTIEPFTAQQLPPRQRTLRHRCSGTRRPR